jgi:oligogalacturonide lyase
VLFRESLHAAARGQVLPQERVRFADPATENEVIRLTNPEFTSVLPPPQNRSASSRGGFVIYSSDRTGTLQAMRMDLRTGESRVLTEAAKLDPDSLQLTADEKHIAYADGESLRITAIGAGRDRESARCPVERAPGLSVSEDLLHTAWIERQGGSSRLQLASVGRSAPLALAEIAGPAERPQIRPKRAAVLYQSAGGLWLVNFDGAQNRRLKTVEGSITLAEWSPDGRTVLYLLGGQLREHTPDTNADTLVANTSQFASFHRNGDASVFVGASRSLAGPFVLLLLRVARRELVLCEHKCSVPERTHTVFSPSSQRVFFQSDRHGKMALYTMAIDRLVEKTETE